MINIDISDLRESHVYDYIIQDLMELSGYIPQVEWLRNKTNDKDKLLEITSSNLRETIQFIWNEDGYIDCRLNNVGFTDNCTIQETCELLEEAGYCEIVKDRVIRDNKVAVIQAVRDQWYTAHEQKDLLFCPPLVEVLLKLEYTHAEVIQALLDYGCKIDEKEVDLEFVYTLKYKSVYLSIDVNLSENLKVRWLNKNEIFTLEYIIDEEGVWENVKIYNPNDWLVA